MTENELRQQPVKWLQAMVGTSKRSAAHQKILDEFNGSGRCKRYKMTLSDYHCAATASAAMSAVGLGDIFPCYECSCGQMIRLAKAAGIWVENDAYVPSVADKVLYDWDDNGKGDCVGDPEHVGTVESVNKAKGTMTVLEGNMGALNVGRRTLAINGRYIRGFITPKFASKATSTASGSTTTKPAAASSALKVGDIVKVVNAVNYDNGKTFKTYYGKYDVIEVKGDRIVIGIGKTVVAPVKASNLSLISGSIAVGDKVKVLKAVTYDGKAFKTYSDKYDVIEVKGDRVVIGIGKTVTAAVKIGNLAKA